MKLPDRQTAGRQKDGQVGRRTSRQMGRQADTPELN